MGSGPFLARFGRLWPDLTRSSSKFDHDVAGAGSFLVKPDLPCPDQGQICANPHQIWSLKAGPNSFLAEFDHEMVGIGSFVIEFGR